MKINPMAFLKPAPLSLPIAVFLGALVFVPRAQPQTPPADVRPQGTLTLRQPVERELGPGQADLFTVEVTSGQFLHVVAQQQGVDVAVVLADRCVSGEPMALFVYTSRATPRRGRHYLQTLAQ